MYWGQAAIALVVAITTGYAVVGTGRGSVVAGAAALGAYIVARWFFAWVFRIRYWYQNGTRGDHYDWCPNCNSRRHRLAKDWILTCRTCGWKPGHPLVRWLTRSVPARQLRRTVVGPTLPVFVIAVAVVAVGPISIAGAVPGGVLTDAPGTSGAEDTPPAPSEAPQSTPTTDPKPAITATPQPSAGHVGTAPEPGVNISEIAREVHRFVNAERRKRGLRPLDYDTELAAIARSHSRDMATDDYFTHESPEGETFLDRYDEAGYECRVSTGGSSYLTGAENIAYTYAYRSVETDRGLVSYDGNETAIAHGIVTGWMNSPPHRENILTPEWNAEGIGIALDDEGDGTRVYATQNFC